MITQRNLIDCPTIVLQQRGHPTQAAVTRMLTPSPCRAFKPTSGEGLLRCICTHLLNVYYEQINSKTTKLRSKPDSQAAHSFKIQIHSVWSVYLGQAHGRHWPTAKTLRCLYFHDPYILDGHAGSKQKTCSVKSSMARNHG